MSKTKLKITGVIPARMESTRFPGKPLAMIEGREMILWVAGAASKARNLSRLVVATDSDRIRSVVEKAGFKCEMTSKFCRTGSDRICEVAMRATGDVFVNIQGDEPLIDPGLIDAVTEPFLKMPGVKVATAISGIRSMAEYENPACVKAVVTREGFAMYFSRSGIPFFRSAPPDVSRVYKHIGIYAYTREALLDFSNMDKSPCEEAESLEQLRFLENGHGIYCVKTDYAPRGVDTPADLEEVIRIIKDKRCDRS